MADVFGLPSQDELKHYKIAIADAQAAFRLVPDDTLALVKEQFNSLGLGGRYSDRIAAAANLIPSGLALALHPAIEEQRLAAERITSLMTLCPPSVMEGIKKSMINVQPALTDTISRALVPPTVLDSIREFNARLRVDPTAVEVEDRTDTGSNSFPAEVDGPDDQGSRTITPPPRRSTREERLERRLRATCIGVAALVDPANVLDQDEDHVILRREAVERARGVARRNRRDLEAGDL